MFVNTIKLQGVKSPGPQKINLTCGEAYRDYRPACFEALSSQVGQPAQYGGVRLLSYNRHSPVGCETIC